MTQLSSAGMSSAGMSSAGMSSAGMSSAGMSSAGASWPGTSWHCAGCNEERLFEQFHADPATCPDVPDGDCQEWACTVCGDAVIIGLPAPAYDHGGSAVRAA